MTRSPEPLVTPISPHDIVSSGLCIGCGACAAGGEAEMRWDAYGQLKPSGKREWYRRRSDAVARTCPFSPSAADEDTIAAERFAQAAEADARIGRFEAAYVGSVSEGEWRERGSSGGMVSWVASELLRTGAVDGVVHVKPVDPATTGRHFSYTISRTSEEVGEGAKSRYYPVDLSGALRHLRRHEGRFAVVGIPCFIKAAHLLRRADPLIAERITHTLGLFCGHMKSAHFVQSFAWQLGVDLGNVRALDYRAKEAGRPANWYRAQLELASGDTVARDWWHLADGDWGAGFFQNPACSYCDDVVAETADISFGDAWIEPYSSDGRGTNVVVVRDRAMCAIIDRAVRDGRLALERVDADFVARTQAAGLRHRRQGLAYRLTWPKGGTVRPRKRVAASAAGLPLRRRLVFRARAAITAWSHRLMWLARLTRLPAIYLVWARLSLRGYQALTWSRGTAGRLVDALLPQSE